MGTERRTKMQKYIGTKMVEAEKTENGYRVRYEDGYESFSPADVFEKAYMPLLANGCLKTEKPSISQRMVDDFIAFHEVKTLGGKTTIVRAVLRNGFEIVESSSCVSAENYDEMMGEAICMGKVKDKVWMLLGFLLQTAVNGTYGAATCPDDR